MVTQLFISVFLILNSFLSVFSAPMPTAAWPVPVTEEDGLIWQAERRLSWEDFQSAADMQEPLHAMTSTNLEVQANCYGNQMQFEVKCVFKSKESWSKNKQSLRLLAHEQMHFDLTEVHARLLRQKLNQTPGLCGSSQARFAKVVDAHFAAWKKEQSQYDQESNHGLNLEQQQLWEEKIALRLAALNAFAYAAGK